MSEQDYLSEAIRAARRRAGLSQAELAAALGVRQSSVSQWERGSTRPSTDHLLALTSILRTTLLDFSAAAAAGGAGDGSGGQGLAAAAGGAGDESGGQGLAAADGGAGDGSGGQGQPNGAGREGVEDGSGGGSVGGEAAVGRPSAVVPGAGGGERVR
jgi:transcriptional regulator with XRE-family HTH domain